MRSELRAGLVLMPVVVRLELLAGVSRRERQWLRESLDVLAVQRPSENTWARIEAWGVEAAAKGRRFSLPDLIIAALAAELDAELWTLDKAFDAMAETGWVKLFNAPPSGPR